MDVRKAVSSRRGKHGADEKKLVFCLASPRLLARRRVHE